jgi:hypothetical protein
MFLVLSSVNHRMSFYHIMLPFCLLNVELLTAFFPVVSHLLVLLSELCGVFLSMTAFFL